MYWNVKHSFVVSVVIAGYTPTILSRTINHRRQTMVHSMHSPGTVILSSHDDNDLITEEYLHSYAYSVTTRDL